MRRQSLLLAAAAALAAGPAIADSTVRRGSNGIEPRDPSPRRADKRDDDRPKWLRMYSRRYESVPMLTVRARRRADKKRWALS